MTKSMRDKLIGLLEQCIAAIKLDGETSATKGSRRLTDNNSAARMDELRRKRDAKRLEKLRADAAALEESLTRPAVK